MDQEKKKRKWRKTVIAGFLTIGLCTFFSQFVSGAWGRFGGDYYEYGDVLWRTVGERSYSFRCIDEDYVDPLGNYNQVALFLCDTIIGADVEGDDTSRNLIQFGETNNYRDSEVRQWLNQNTRREVRGEISFVGILQAYGGSTPTNYFEDLNGHQLFPYEIQWQVLWDEMFLLSVEEAITYKNELWRFQGSKENNPEAVYRPYAKGYYLRTPLYQEREKVFCYGDGIYAVDLLGGTIVPVKVSYKTMGMRPAFVIPNG